MEKSSIEVEHESFSPSLVSRKDEKNQMINLNNRLAIYVEKVRSLELKNSNLQAQLAAYDENTFNEVDTIKVVYQTELHEARQLLDEVAKEKAELEIQINSLQDKLNSKIKRENDLVCDNQILEKMLKEARESLAKQSAMYDEADFDRNKLADDLDELKNKVSNLEEEFDRIRNALNKETLLRIDFENKLQTAQEEIQFKERVHKKEIDEVRMRKTLNVNEEIKSGEDHDNEMEDVIEDLREEQKLELDRLKKELVHNYTLKIKSLTDELQLTRSSLFKSQESVKSYENKVRRLQDSNKALQEHNNNIDNKLEDVKGELATERQLHISALARVEEEKKKTLDTLEMMEKDNKELLEVKLKLDQEISVYNKLLEGEEQRLHLSPSPRGGAARAGNLCRVRRKRKREVISTPCDAEAKKSKKDARLAHTNTHSILCDVDTKNSATGEDPPDNNCQIM